jgi:predicted HicB family RNase H-like nuclease
MSSPTEPHLSFPRLASASDDRSDHTGNDQLETAGKVQPDPRSIDRDRHEGTNRSSDAGNQRIDESMLSTNPTDRQAEDSGRANVIDIHPGDAPESQGSQTVRLDIPSDQRPLHERPAIVLQLAQEAFTQTGYWVAFYRSILARGGVVDTLFPSQEELEFFHTSAEFVEVQKMLTALRTSDQEKSDAVEPLKMITIRIPKSMQSTLVQESKRHGVSVNKLCISKLLVPIHADFVPTERGKVKGRKPSY